MTILLKNDHLDQKYTFGQEIAYRSKMIILTKNDFFHPFRSKMTDFKQNMDISSKNDCRTKIFLRNINIRLKTTFLTEN